MQADELRTKVAKGTAVNFIGVLAKFLHPIFILAMTRVYGPSIMGVYLVANTVVELSISFTFSGFQAGVLMFASRHVHSDERRDLVYRVMANAFTIAVGLTLLAIGLAFAAAPGFFAAKYPGREGLAEAVQLMALALPFLAVPRIVVSGTKSLMIMKWDVILLGVLRPGLLLAFAVAMYFFEPSVTGLAWAFLLSNMGVTVVALYAFTRHFEVARLLAAFRPLRLHWPLIRFAIPQSLNQTLIYFTSGIAVLMLGSWESSIFVAFFATGAEMVRQVKQARIAFSRAFTPVISRLHAEGRFEELGDQFSMVSRWVVTVNIPILLLILSLKEPLLLLFHETYVWDSSFMYFLAASTFVGGLLGLANNVVSMTGRSDLNLLNSLIVGAVAVALNWLLIPAWGLYGAGVATCLAASTNTLLATLEIWVLYRITLRPRAVAKPLAAGAAGLAAMAVISILFPDGLSGSVLKAVASAGCYVGVLIALGVEAQDRQVFRSMMRRR